MKCFLAVSLLSLTPSLAFAEQYDFGDLEFLSTRAEYVSIRPEETIQLPVRRSEGAPSSLLASTSDNFYIANWTNADTFPGYSLVGTPNPLPPNPLRPTAPPSISGYFQMILPEPMTHTQVYYYTTNAADPTGAAKTCRWQLNISYTNGVCSGTINQAAFGTMGVVCSLDTTQSFIDPSSCYAQIVTAIQ